MAKKTAVRRPPPNLKSEVSRTPPRAARNTPCRARDRPSHRSGASGCQPWDGGVGLRACPKTARDVLVEALRLEPDSRADVAAELLASLDGPGDPDAEAAWDAVEVLRKRSTFPPCDVRYVSRA